MTEIFNQLLETLNDEMTYYRNMQAVLVQERDAATKSSKDQLVYVGQDKQAIVQQLKQAENRRQELIEQLASQYDIQGRPLTIKRLCASLTGPDALRLKTVGDDLKTLVKTVQQENNANAKLFTHSLELVHGSLKMLNELVYSQAVYSKPGSDRQMQGYAGHRGKVFCRSV
jgi:flagellar biosynthesis/type III secretory pathway chaperone